MKKNTSMNNDYYNEAKFKMYIIDIEKKFQLYVDV